MLQIYFYLQNVFGFFFSRHSFFLTVILFWRVFVMTPYLPGTSTPWRASTNCLFLQKKHPSTEHLQSHCKLRLFLFTDLSLKPWWNKRNSHKQLSRNGQQYFQQHIKSINIQRNKQSILKNENCQMLRGQWTVELKLWKCG